MKDIYYFGITKIKDDIAVDEPVIIDEKGVWEINDYEFFEGIKKGVIIRKGIWFMSSNNVKPKKRIIENGVFLEPYSTKQNLSVYFLDDKKIILFKLNNPPYSLKEKKDKVIELCIKPFSFSDKDIANKIYFGLHEEYEAHDSAYYILEKNDLVVQVREENSLFIYIKSKDYNHLKKQIMSKYPKPKPFKSK